MKWNLVCSAVVPSPRDVLPGVLLDPHHLADLLLHPDDPHHQESQQECGEKICVQRKQQDWQIRFSQTSSWQQEADHQNVRWELFKWETVLNIHFNSSECCHSLLHCLESFPLPETGICLLQELGELQNCQPIRDVLFRYKFWGQIR